MISIDLERLASLGDKLRASGTRFPLRRLALAVAAIGFGGGLILSIRLLPENIVLAVPGMLLKIALLGVPIRLAVSIWELKLSAAFVQARLSWSAAARFSLVASAANMLPLPGGSLVRVAALNMAGGTIRKSSAVTVLSGLVWLGLAFAVAGCLLLATEPDIARVLLIIAGLTLLVSGLGLYRSEFSGRLVGLLFLVKTATVAVGLLRLHWAFGALGVETDIRQLGVFAIANVSGAIVAIVPGGLGISEGVAAGLAPLVGISSSVAFLAASLNRLVGLPILLLAALLATTCLKGRSGGMA